MSSLYGIFMSPTQAIEKLSNRRFLHRVLVYTGEDQFFEGCHQIQGVLTTLKKLLITHYIQTCKQSQEFEERVLVFCKEIELEGINNQRRAQAATMIIYCPAALYDRIKSPLQNPKYKGLFDLHLLLYSEEDEMKSTLKYLATEQINFQQAKLGISVKKQIPSGKIKVTTYVDSGKASQVVNEISRVIQEIRRKQLQGLQTNRPVIRELDRCRLFWCMKSNPEEVFHLLQSNFPHMIFFARALGKTIPQELSSPRVSSKAIVEDDMLKQLFCFVVDIAQSKDKRILNYVAPYVWALQLVKGHYVEVQQKQELQILLQYVHAALDCKPKSGWAIMKSKYQQLQVYEEFNVFCSLKKITEIRDEHNLLSKAITYLKLVKAILRQTIPLVQLKPGARAKFLKDEPITDYITCCLRLSKAYLQVKQVGLAQLTCHECFQILGLEHSLELKRLNQCIMENNLSPKDRLQIASLSQSAEIWLRLGKQSIANGLLIEILRGVELRQTCRNHELGLLFSTYYRVCLAVSMEKDLQANQQQMDTIQKFMWLSLHNLDVASGQWATIALNCCRLATVMQIFEGLLEVVKSRLEQNHMFKLRICIELKYLLTSSKCKAIRGIVYQPQQTGAAIANLTMQLFTQELQQGESSPGIVELKAQLMKQVGQLLEPADGPVNG